MKAIVVGATGAVGRDLVEVLCNDPRYTEVRTFTRRELGIENPKIRPYIVDFERTEGWHDLVQGDVIFSALGTSKKQAGSKEAQYHIDHDYQMMFAQFAKKNGVRHMVLVSSAGADASSAFFYMKLKGEIENDMEALGFEGLTIVQPPSLIRKHAKRPLETISVKALQLLNAVGLFRSMAPISTEIVAHCMGLRPALSRSAACGGSASRPSAISASKRKSQIEMMRSDAGRIFVPLGKNLYKYLPKDIGDKMLFVILR